MVSIEVQKHLGSDDVGNATHVVFIIRHQTNIALFQVGEVIKNDELNALVEDGFHFRFNHRDLFRGIPGCILGQLFPIQVEIGIEVIKFVISPQKIVVLYPVFSKRLVRSIIKLSRCWVMNEQYRNDNNRIYTKKHPPWL